MMRLLTTFTRCIILLTVVLVGGYVGRAGAQELEAPRIGIVDVQRVLRDAAAAKSVRPEIDRLRKAFQNQVKEQERALRVAEQQLTQQRAILSREAFADKRKAFSEQASNAQREVQEQRRNLDEAFNTTKNVILENMIQVAQEIAKKNNLNIVMEKRFVFISAKVLDITDEILVGLDKRLPVVTIDTGKPKDGKGGAKGKP